MFRRRRFPVEIILVCVRWYCKYGKYLNNIIEADHGALKRVIKPTRGFQSMRTATATIKGFEIMRMIRKRVIFPSGTATRSVLEVGVRLF